MRRTCMLHTVYFSSSSVVSRAFSALCAYLTFGHHPHPLGYLCAKLHFCCATPCWASPLRKTAYWIAQSLTHPAYLRCWLPWNETCILHTVFTGLLIFKIQIYKLHSKSISQWLKIKKRKQKCESTSFNPQTVALTSLCDKDPLDNWFCRIPAITTRTIIFTQLAIRVFLTDKQSHQESMQSQDAQLLQT